MHRERHYSGWPEPVRTVLRTGQNHPCSTGRTDACDTGHIESAHLRNCKQIRPHDLRWLGNYYGPKTSANQDDRRTLRYRWCDRYSTSSRSIHDTIHPAIGFRPLRSLRQSCHKACCRLDASATIRTTISMPCHAPANNYSASVRCCQSNPKTASPTNPRMPDVATIHRPNRCVWSATNQPETSRHVRPMATSRLSRAMHGE